VRAYSVVASAIFGWILLLAVTFAIPSTSGALENIGIVVPWIWAESMSQNWSEVLLLVCVIAQFFCVTASTTSAAGTAIAVIGLYIAFILPVILRFRMGDQFEPGAWSLGRHYRWIDAIAIGWVGLITILFVFPLYKGGLPWEDGFSWELTNYTVLWMAGIGRVFGGWWALSARRWFKGPIRQGTDEELEGSRSSTSFRPSLPPPRRGPEDRCGRGPLRVRAHTRMPPA
jgi:hypothetical protein